MAVIGSHITSKLPWIRLHLFLFIRISYHESVDQWVLGFSSKGIESCDLSFCNYIDFYFHIENIDLKNTDGNCKVVQAECIVFMIQAMLSV